MRLRSDWREGVGALSLAVIPSLEGAKIAVTRASLSGSGSCLKTHYPSSGGRGIVCCQVGATIH